MTTTPQAALLSRMDAYLSGNSCEATAIIKNARDLLAKLQATQELVQAGSASLLDGCKSIMDSIAVSSSVIEHNKQEPVQAGELLLQGGLTNEQLREAFGEKMPGVVPSDRDLTLFALGIEVGAAELADERRMKKCILMSATVLVTHGDAQQTNEKKPEPPSQRASR